MVCLPKSGLNLRWSHARKKEQGGRQSDEGQRASIRPQKPCAVFKALQERNVPYPLLKSPAVYNITITEIRSYLYAGRDHSSKAPPFVFSNYHTNAEFLRSLGIGDFDVCIVTISGNFQNSLETTSLLKELGAKRVVSRAERDVQAKFLLRNGADHVVYPEKQVAKWAAIRYTADHIFDYIEFDEQHAIFEVEVPEDWVGKSIGELNIRSKFGINILGIKHSGKTDVSITPDTVLSGEMTILALGEYKALQKCFRI